MRSYVDIDIIAISIIHTITISHVMFIILAVIHKLC
jgi:hypothetical protein